MKLRLVNTVCTVSADQQGCRVQALGWIYFWLRMKII